MRFAFFETRHKIICVVRLEKLSWSLADRINEGSFGNVYAIQFSTDEFFSGNERDALLLVSDRSG